MTTVAWDGKTLATDSATVTGSLFTGLTTKKVHVCPDGRSWRVNGVNVLAFASAGDSSAIGVLESLLEKGLDYDTEINSVHEFTAILVCGVFNAYHVYKEKDYTGLCISFLNDKAVTGSGYAVAETAMFLGCTATKAIETAIQLDNNTAGTVQTFTISA